MRVFRVEAAHPEARLGTTCVYVALKHQMLKGACYFQKRACQRQGLFTSCYSLGTSRALEIVYHLEALQGPPTEFYEASRSSQVPASFVFATVNSGCSADRHTAEANNEHESTCTHLQRSILPIVSGRVLSCVCFDLPCFLHNFIETTKATLTKGRKPFLRSFVFVCTPSTTANEN